MTHVRHAGNYLPGQSGNPAGRKKGVTDRVRLDRLLSRALEDEWKKDGKKVLSYYDLFVKRVKDMLENKEGDAQNLRFILNFIVSRLEGTPHVKQIPTDMPLVEQLKQLNTSDDTLAPEVRKALELLTKAVTIQTAAEIQPPVAGTKLKIWEQKGRQKAQ